MPLRIAAITCRIQWKVWAGRPSVARHEDGLGRQSRIPRRLSTNDRPPDKVTQFSRRSVYPRLNVPREFCGLLPNVLRGQRSPAIERGR